MKYYSVVLIATCLFASATGTTVDFNEQRKLQFLDFSDLINAILSFIGISVPDDDEANALAAITNLYNYHNQTAINIALSTIKEIRANHTSNGVPDEHVPYLKYGNNDYSADGFAHSDFDVIEEVLTALGGTLDDAKGLLDTLTTTRNFNLWAGLGCAAGAALTGSCALADPETAGLATGLCIGTGTIAAGQCGNIF